ncbi:MAG: hypothetical protein WCF54_10100 [Terracidiphilus sp.]
MNLSGDQTDMAFYRYGYGDWSAPCWFLGTQEESHPDEGSDLKERIEVWRALGSRDLDDCLLFLPEMARILKLKNKMQGEDAIVNPTWIKLQLVLRAYWGIAENTLNHKSRQQFQEERWGRHAGISCIVHLSGLAATDANRDLPADLFRPERFAYLREKIFSNHPQFVVMYGMTRNDSLENFSEFSEKIPRADTALAKFRRVERTIFALTPHPTAFGSTNADWIELGETLRRLVNESS